MNNLYKNTLLLLFLINLLSCSNNKQQLSNERKEEIYDSINIEINKYDFKSDIDFLEFLSDEKIDSLIFNWNEFKLKSSYDKNKKYGEIANEYREILRFRNWVKEDFASVGQYYNSFKRFLLPKELSKLNADSVSQIVKYSKLWRKRDSLIRKKTGKFYFSNYYPSESIFTDQEVHQFIKDSFQVTQYYKNIIADRRLKDSINYWTTYYKRKVARQKRKDSLQSIIHPIDSVLPFGPNGLGKLIANGQNKISFSINKDSVPDIKNIQARKEIYSTWMYFLKLHPYADADLSENYVEKLMPPVKTYEYINLGVNIDGEDQIINPKYVHYQTRISNIGKYEVYYTTTGTDYPTECSEYLKKEENCCYGEEFYCESTGYIILYDREKQHCIVLPAFALKSAGQGYFLDTQFFYIENSTINIYKGWFGYETDWAGSKRVNEKYSAELAKTFSIEILTNGNLAVNEECILKDGINQEKYYKEGINSVNMNFRHNEKWFLNKRDSVISKIQPLVSSYPFGSSTLKQLSAFKDNLKLVDSTLKYYNFPRNEEKLHSFYTLPLTNELNKINIGQAEYWDKSLLQNLQKSWICSNIEFDSDDINDFMLPTIRNYEVYLSVYHGNNGLKGILTLYNHTTKVANVINVLDGYNDSNFRFFNINTNNQIEICQGYKNQTSENNKKHKITISKTHIIEVLSNGKINVIKQ